MLTKKAHYIKESLAIDEVKAFASMRQAEALDSVIFFIFLKGGIKTLQANK